MNCIFNTYNDLSPNGISSALKQANTQQKTPIFVCIGSDLVLGDSLGPLVGTLLRKKNILPFVYGTLNYPITAKEVQYAKNYVKLMHKNSTIIAIDAAVGSSQDVGQIKVIDKGIKPGLGVKKDLEEIGDVSIIGIVSSKSENNYNLYNLTRLNLIYKMAERIAEGIESYIKNVFSNQKVI